MLNTNSAGSAASLEVYAVGQNEWRFEFSGFGYAEDDPFDHALEYLRAGKPSSAIPILQRLTDEYPEHVDARHHLALALDQSGANEEAYATWQSVVRMCLTLLPPGFVFGRDTLIWGFSDNRPFLRAYMCLARQHEKRGLVGEAATIYQNIIDINPNDNQGARFLLVRSLFRLQRALDVLRVCDRYEEDVRPDLLYGRVLALYQLGEERKSREALMTAMRWAPLVARELVKRTHRRPKEWSEYYVTAGGADEAYEYWLGTRESWERTVGVLAFVRKALARKNRPGAALE